MILEEILTRNGAIGSVQQRDGSPWTKNKYLAAWHLTLKLLRSGIVVNPKMNQMPASLDSIKTPDLRC